MVLTAASLLWIGADCCSVRSVLTAALSPKGINQILVEKHAKGAVDKVLDNFGMSIGDLMEGFSGDVAIGFYQPEPKENPEVVMVLKVDEQEQVDTLIANLIRQEVIQANSDGSYTVKGYEMILK